MSFLLNPYRFGEVFDFTDAEVAFSFRDLFNLWTNAVVKVRRSSDSAEVWVFFDSSGNLSDDSLTSSSSNTTPGATDMITWISGQNADIVELLGMTPNNTINTNYTVSQSTASKQPLIWGSGVFVTKNGKTAISFPAAINYLDGTAISALAHGNNYTVVTVSSNNVSASLNTVLTTSAADSNRFAVINDSRTNKLCALVRVSGTTYSATLISQQNNTNQKLISAIGKSSRLLTAYYNGTEQNNNTYAAGTYVNDVFRIGADFDELNDTDGTFQESIIYASDKTSVISDIHDAVNNYYSIY